MPTMNGAGILLECLRREDVQYVFGYPGAALLPLYDAFYDCYDIKHILVRHEQGAAHMADGYARATGKVGVCLATSGPGATNLITGIATAWMDSTPMVAITGQVKSHVIGTDAFQEADAVGLTMPITKQNFLVHDIESLPEIMAKAFSIALSGRRGPVLVDIPADIFAGITEWDPSSYKSPVDIPSYRPTYKGHLLQIKRAADAINKAERPLLYVGGGAVASGAREQITQLSHKADILVTTTLLGKGAIDECDSNCLGMLGMHGSAYANYAINHCDLLIAVGARFDDRVTGKVDQFAKSASVIHIDIDPAEIGKVVEADIPIVGDVKQVLMEMLENISENDHDMWNDQVNAWRHRFPISAPQDGIMHASSIIRKIWECMPADTVFATDVGQHQMWAAQHVQTHEPRHFITSGGLGTMGFGLPAAIGAQTANLDKRVVCITGDGSIQMCIQEMMTAVVYELPVIIAIMNNRTLGMVRQWQELFWKERYSATSLEASPDFVKLADAYGAIGIRVENIDDVDSAIDTALAENHRPVLIDFRTITLDNVYPMVPAGQTIDQMMLPEGVTAPKVVMNVDKDAETWSFSDDELQLEQMMKEDSNE